MTTARDVMTKDPSVLESSTDIMDAVDLFSKKKFSSVPVVTTMGDVAGQLTELVLVRILVLHQIQPEKYKKLANCLEFLEPVVFVAPEATVPTIVKSIMKSTSRRILVRLDGRRVLGIISPKDLIRVLVAGQEAAQHIQEVVGKMVTPVKEE